MTRARRALGPIAAVWLACHAATLVLVPVLLDPTLAACMCAHGADATCPMHHGTAARSKHCVMKDVTTNAATTLSSLFSVVGVVAVLALGRASVPAIRPVRLESSRVTQQPSPPDPPPPRA